MDIFNSKINENKVQKIVRDSLKGLDDGELYLEYRQSESLVFDDNILRSSNFDKSQGFGMRAVSGDAIGYAHSSAIDEQSIKESIDIVKAVKNGSYGKTELVLPSQNEILYTKTNPIEGISFFDKVKLLENINEYVRSKDDRVKQVSISLAGEWKAVQIINIDGNSSSDIRPLVRLNITV